jgi:hypothetical protein
MNGKGNTSTIHDSFAVNEVLIRSVIITAKPEGSSQS